MIVDESKTKKYVELTQAGLLAKYNYVEFTCDESNIMLVEGSIDKLFYNRQNDLNAKFFSANDIINDGDILRNDYDTDREGYINNKELIANVINGINQPGTTLFEMHESGKWNVFGVIDLDFDRKEDFKKIPRLLVTDTHDLETMMIKTDSSIFKKIKGFSLTDEELKAALTLAYEAGKLKKAMINSELDIGLLNDENSLLEYNHIMDDGDISIDKVLQFYNEKCFGRISKDKLKKLSTRLYDLLRKYVNNQRVFLLNGGRVSYKALEKDLWETVNGHDLLSAIALKNERAACLFYSADSKLNRSFEEALVNAYDCNCFKSTELYSEMADAGLVNYG